MNALPSGGQALINAAQRLIDDCRATVGQRAAYYHELARISEAGREDGTRSQINMLYRHLDRVASHLFSPTELQFAVDFDEDYSQDIMLRGNRAARLLTRKWTRANTDMVYGIGVFEALRYGAVFLKQWPSMTANGGIKYNRGLVMPWQFGVYREDTNDIAQHPALCETFMLTMPEVWRRIWHLPDAEKLYKRIEAHAGAGQQGDETNSFFHNLMSTAPLQTGLQGVSRPMPGGIVQVTNGQSTGMPQIVINAPLVKMHELWAWDEDDYTTIQLIEPDILVAPLLRKANLLISARDAPETGTQFQPAAEKSQLHPYTLIQPNMTHGRLWGRSELADLIEPQNTLGEMAADQKRLVQLQIDKLYTSHKYLLEIIILRFFIKIKYS